MLMHPEKPMEIQKLAALAARAEQVRLSPARRARVLAAASRPAAAAWPAWAQASLAAAALLVVLSAPALLIDGNAAGKGAGQDADLNLQVRLGSNGSVVLEWENGKPVHTLKMATSRGDLAKVNGIKVSGRRFEDDSRASAEIVYYQVD
jgi:hypothetical protein